MAIEKVMVSAEQERQDCWAMAADICKNEEPFDLVVGITRGGGPIAFYLQEFFSAYWKNNVSYATLRTRSYDDIASAGKVEVGSLHEVKEELGEGKRVLIADDIFDRGMTIVAVVEELRKQLPAGTEIKVATLYWKPENNVVDSQPDYFVRKYRADEWIVFPHSISDLDNINQLKEFGVPGDICGMFKF